MTLTLTYLKQEMYLLRQLGSLLARGFCAPISNVLDRHLPIGALRLTCRYGIAGRPHVELFMYFGLPSMSGRSGLYAPKQAS